MPRARTHLDAQEFAALNAVLIAVEAGNDPRPLLSDLRYQAARAKLQRRAQTPPSQAANDAAFEDAVVLQEMGECSLMRAASLASAYHRAAKYAVYERLRRHFEYRSGRMGQGRYPRLKREESAA